jgi:hypothetical protein
MLFKLNQYSQIREIQIGFINYWATDSEVCVEPSSVLIQGGADRDNLKHIATLENISDSAYLSVNSTIFAKNLLQYDSNAMCNSESISDIIESKVDSIENFKCQWIKFSMRRNNPWACIENSPLSSRQQKPHMLSINYISMQGYDLSQVRSNPQNFIVKEQKKAALQVMSLICQGEFSSTLKIIAN